MGTENRRAPGQTSHLWISMCVLKAQPHNHQLPTLATQLAAAQGTELQLSKVQATTVQVTEMQLTAPLTTELQQLAAV